MAVTFDPAFDTLMDKYGVPDGFKDFLLKQGIVCAESFGMLASDEAEIKVEIIEVAKGAGVQFEQMAGKVAVKKLWKTCREGIKTQDKAESSAIDAPLSKETEDDIKASWRTLHGFVIPEEWLLVVNLQGKLWRDAVANPPRIDTILVENLRPMSCSDRSVGTQLSIVPGRTVETQAVMVDHVSKPIELYSRCRAWFITMAFVNIRRQAWFDYQSAIFGSERILKFVSQTFQGQHAPVSFYAQAWASTIHYFSESVRLSQMTLKEAVKNTGAWEHRWTNWVPARSGDPQPGGKSSGPDLPKDVQDEIAKLRESVKNWQAQADRNKAWADKYHELRRAGKGKSDKGSSMGGKRGASRSPGRNAEIKRRRTGDRRR